MDDMFQALELMTGSGAKVERKWNLAHRLSVVLKPVKCLDLDMRVVTEKQGRYPKNKKGSFCLLAAAALRKNPIK